MSKNTIYSEACYKVIGFQQMSEEFIQKLVINLKSVKLLNWQFILGIQHGVCKCGGKMHIIKTVANKFRKGSRVPPYVINLVNLNNSVSEY